jgi:hypothetical protein
MNEKENLNLIHENINADRQNKINVIKPFIKSDLSIRIADNMENLNWGESYFGAPFGSFIQNMDAYEDKQKRNKIIKENIREYLYENPTFDKYVYINDENQVEVITGVAIQISNWGYAVYPDPKSVVTLDN